MTDIVERLRATRRAEIPARASLWEEAAEEIERLRKALRDVVDWADDLQIYAEPEHHMHPVFYNARSALEEKE